LVDRKQTLLVSLVILFPEKGTNAYKTTSKMKETHNTSALKKAKTLHKMIDWEAGGGAQCCFLL